MLKILPNSKSPCGAALVIALAIMVLVLALIVGILARVSTDRAAAGGYAATVEARLLADTAVQVVQAQIDVATSEGAGIAWSSQPGLLRTFDSTGKPSKSYKLYSDAGMQVSGALDPAAEAVTLKDWYQSPAVFTDINMPADSDFNGTPDRWPILDPAADGVVEGFAVNNAPTGKYLGIQNAAPMPVRWLYVLKEGQLVAPTGSGATATVDAATDANPIVGRIAFWTDDETCKVNVNTASEGTYWDVPKGTGPAERILGKFQPATNEFQSYPGHPASTSLSAVFPELTRAQLFDLVPRLSDGGSKNATLAVDAAAPVPLDQDRLYSTEDEIVFANNRTGNTSIGKALVERGKFFLTTVSRAPETNLFNLPKVVCWPVHAINTPEYRTPFDRLFAFCGELNGSAYFFQRKDSGSTTEDYSGIPRNKTVLKYLQTLTGRPVPGFGGNLASKYQTDKDQILTEIFDYIRCTNLSDGNLAPDKQYAGGKELNGAGGGRFGFGQVLPIEIADFNTRGFGRVPVITEVGLWIICTADSKVLSPPAATPSNDPATNKTLDAAVALTYDDVKKTKQVRIEAALVLEPFIPLAGYKDVTPDIEITVSGLEQWKIRGNATGDTDKNLGFPSLAQQADGDAGRFLMSRALGSYPYVYPRGGHIGVWAMMEGRGIRARNNGRLGEDPEFATAYKGGGGINNQQYPFVGEPVTVNVDANSNGTAARLILDASPVVVRVIHRPSGKVLQTYDLDFPDAGQLPLPLLRFKPSWTFQTGGFLGFRGRLHKFAEAIYPFTEDGFAQSGLSSFGYADVVRSIVPAYGSGGTQSADFRLLSMKDQIGTSDFAKHPLFDGNLKLAHSFVTQWSGWHHHLTRGRQPYGTFTAALGGDVTNLAKATGSLSTGWASTTINKHPDTPYPATDAQATGDWDNGVGIDIDGPYLNKPDEGNTWSDLPDGEVAYINDWGHSEFDTGTFFSPNRIIPSPGMFGSLPTGVKRNRHWQTLLFRRQPGHPNYTATAGNFTGDPDYLWLDLFWMPVVEPYAISEPLSTAGKINMNQQIVPFTWIERNTGLHAILKNEKVASIPNGEIGKYKGDNSLDSRQSVDIPETLSQLKFRFDNTDKTGLFAFRSPAEICDIHIVPDDASVSTADKAALDADMKAYWESHALTGDNSRERIYTTLYSRLTTRSNTYTVNFRVQTLKQRPGGDPKAWNENTGVITCDYRGSTTLERYIDPNNTGIPDYAADPDATPTLDTFYRWRLRSHRPFTP